MYETYIDKDTGAPAVCIGRIQRIIEHQLYPDSRDKHVLIECDWYSPTGTSTPSGLLQVSLDVPMSTGARWTFLKDMYRTNVILWPTYSHTPNFHAIPDTFAVLLHTALVADDDDDEACNVDEDDDNDSDSSDED